MSTVESRSPPRLRRSPAAARENILDAAQAILIDSGPQHLKLAEVAARAGVVHATVLHHFGSIDGVQTALMTRMVEDLVGRIIAISDRTADAGQMAGEATAALFDTFEEKGVARLAAWLELTGQSSRLTLVREAVRTVIAARDDTDRLATPEALEDFLLACVSIALGVGLFGATLSGLLGKPKTRARELALALLQARVAKAQGAARP